MNKDYLSENLPLFRIYTFDSIQSTNTFAKSLKDNFALITADFQSMGRGRLGRTFVSPSSSGIYMSIVFPVENMYANVPFITTAAAVSVHRAISSLTQIDCSIKWVNDIYKGNKKVAGILCESIDEKRCVTGIGLNLFPSQLPEVATSLFDHIVPIKKEDFVTEITKNLMEIINALPDTQFIEYYKKHSMVIGRDILCIQGEHSFPAKAIDITSSGALIVQAEDGIHTLSTGEISIRFTN